MRKQEYQQEQAEKPRFGDHVAKFGRRATVLGAVGIGIGFVGSHFGPAINVGAQMSTSAMGVHALAATSVMAGGSAVVLGGAANLASKVLPRKRVAKKMRLG